ncbi:hypothetical protein [Ralstonia solanacearum]|uniref:hypothetical protein n=1 Tax=Ralstonia solanacearum TaxID=305 RepID=UPI0009E98A8D
MSPTDSRKVGGSTAIRVEVGKPKRGRDATQDTPLMRALGLAHYWQRLLDEQRVASVAEIAEAEGVNVTHVRHILRLTMLAPTVIARLIASSETVLARVMRRSVPRTWDTETFFQRDRL